MRLIIKDTNSALQIFDFPDDVTSNRQVTKVKGAMWSVNGIELRRVKNAAITRKESS